MEKLLLIFLILNTLVSDAQQPVKKTVKPKKKIAAEPLDPEIDSAYYRSYYKLITGRVYLSQKYTSLTLTNSRDNYDFSYRPNTTLNLGVGATYKWATLNLAYGFPFLNPNDGRGKTKYLDLQAHFYGRKFIIDLFGEFYKGFYLSPQGKLANQFQYYLRPDLSVNEIGTSIQYVFNSKKFSYRSSFLQNEWQRKSSGSVIAGAEIHTGWIIADSSVVVTEDATAPAIELIRKFNYFEIGPNLGYAYTLVIHKNYFLSASLAYSLVYGTNTSHDDFNSPDKSNGFGVNNIFRIFAGYNSTWHAFSVTWVNSHVSLSNKANSTTIDLNTGNVRASYIKRFKPGKRARNVLKHI